MKNMVSIIMPVHNGEKFLAESIVSVIQQSYQNWELIIIDDGSTDRTSEIIADFIVTDDRIRAIFQSNKKQGLARNEGIRSSKGNIIAFLDADDFWMENKLEIMVNFLHQSKCDLVFSDAFIQHEDFSNDATEIKNETFGVTNSAYGNFNGVESFLLYNRIPLLTVLVKRQAVLEVGLFNNRGVSEDYELWLKLLLNGFVFQSLNKALAVYRVHSKSTTHQDKLAIEDNIDVIFCLYKNANETYKKLFKDYLKVWYRRRLKTIADFNSYKNFLGVIAIQNPGNIKYQLFKKINGGQIGYHVHKKLLFYMI